MSVALLTKSWRLICCRSPSTTAHRLNPAVNVSEAVVQWKSIFAPRRVASKLLNTTGKLSGNVIGANDVPTSTAGNEEEVVGRASWPQPPAMLAPGRKPAGSPPVNPALAT